MLTGTLSPTSRSCTMRLLVNARRAETTATRERIAASMECAALAILHSLSLEIGFKLFSNRLS